MKAAEHPFEKLLQVSREEASIILRGMEKAPWSDFFLNPRRLRGSDFLMRWQQGVWSEECLTQAVNATEKYFALPYGPSGTAPDDDVRAFELYFERLEKAGLGKIKRPDLLIFRASHKPQVGLAVEKMGGLSELPFIPENDARMQALLKSAIMAVECENSLWRASQMPNYHTPLTPQKRLGGKLGLKKAAVLPTVIIKEEDRAPLKAWQKEQKIPLHIWHAFFDLAYGIALSEVEKIISEGKIEPTRQVFQAPGGATTAKVIYKIYYHYAYPLAETIEEPRLVADSITDKNGHILPYVKFEGGEFKLKSEARAVLEALE